MNSGRYLTRSEIGRPRFISSRRAQRTGLSVNKIDWIVRHVARRATNPTLEPRVMRTVTNHGKHRLPPKPRTVTQNPPYLEHGKRSIELATIQEAPI
jgi:hypothetical protein